MGPVRKLVCRFFKSFDQGYELFRLDVLPACPYPSQCLTFRCINLLLPLHYVPVLLELQLQPFSLTYQKFAMLMLQFDLFLQSLKLPLLLSFLFLLIKSVHLHLLLGLLTLLILRVLDLSFLQHFLFHDRRPMTELLQFLLAVYLPVSWLVLLTLWIHLM